MVTSKCYVVQQNSESMSVLKVPKGRVHFSDVNNSVELDSLETDYHYNQNGEVRTQCFLYMFKKNI